MLLLLFRGQQPAARNLTLGVARASYRAAVSWQRNATGYFAIGSSTIGGPDVLAASEWASQYLGTYDDVSSDLHRIGSIRRGRADDLQTIDAGVSTFELRDNLGRYNRQNPASPLAAYLPNALRPTRLRAIGPGLVAGTASSGVVDDAVRTFAAEGDGRSGDRSLGFWRAGTNLLPYSGYDAGGAWIGAGTGVVAEGAAGKFSGGGARRSVRVIAAAGSDGTQQAVTTAAATTYTYSAWVLDAAGGSYAIQLTDNIDQALFAGPFVVPAGVWTQIVGTGVTDGHVARYLRVQRELAAGVFDVDGGQVTASPFVLPLIGSYGLARSRPLGTLTFPSAGVLSQSSGWISALVRVGWGSGAGPSGRVLEWGDATTDWLSVLFDNTTQKWALGRGDAAAWARADNFAFVAGDVVSIVASWGPAGLFVSARKVGAAAPLVRQAADAHTAMTMPATFDVGSSGAADALDGDVLSLAAGTYAALPADHPLLRSVAELQADAARIPASLLTTLVLDGTTSYAVKPGVTSELYNGFERTLEHSPRGRKAYAQIEAVDLFVWLSRLKPIIAERRLLTVGAAIGLVLDAIGWNDVSLRDLEAGEEIPLFDADGQRTALELIEELLAIDRGLFYISKAGVATYRSRVTRASRRPKAAIVNEMTRLGPGVSVDTVVNRATVTKSPDGIPQTYQDDESAHFNGPIDAPSLESRYLRDDAHAASIARAIVEEGRRGHAPLWGLELDYRSSLLLAIALTVEIGDRVTIAAVSGSSAPADYYVEQIEAAVEQPTGRHTSRLVLSEAGPIPFVIGTDAVGGPAPIF